MEGDNRNQYFAHGRRSEYADCFSNRKRACRDLESFAAHNPMYLILNALYAKMNSKLANDANPEIQPSTLDRPEDRHAFSIGLNPELLPDIHSILKFWGTVLCSNY
jgi:hypothetical protein